METAEADTEIDGTHDAKASPNFYGEIERRPMLCLTRKLDEEIVIGGNVRIKIIEITCGRVRLGIIAPDDVRVMRAEVTDTGPQSLPDVIPLTIRHLMETRRKAG